MKGVFVRVLSLRSSVIHGFVTEPWHSLHVLFLCECAVSSVLEPRTLLSACLVLCWSVVFGSRHSCLEFRFRVGVRTLALHVLSHCVSVRLEFARPRALLSTCVVVSGFCHFGLVLFMVLWQSLDTPFMSCFYVSARLRVCSSRALSCLRALFCVGAWCSDPGTHVLSFGFVSGFGHSRSMFCLTVWACGSSSLGRALSCPRVLCVWCCTQSVFLSAACIHVMSCAVWHAARVFHWLRAFMSSCLVWTRSLWVFSLAACSCPVLHMAGDLFCWPCACVFVLCEHMAFVLVFCVPCALMSIVLTPPILLPDYWLICPTCVFLITLLICSLYNLLVFAVPCWFVVECPWKYPVVSCLPCPALPCLVKPGCQLSCFSPKG